MQDDPLHDEQEDEEDCVNDLVDSDDEEDVPHIPNARLSARQRERREYRKAMELACKGAESSMIGGHFAECHNLRLGNAIIAGCREGCCSIKQTPQSQTPSEVKTTAHRLREAKLDELLGCDLRTVLRALGSLEAVEDYVMPVTADDDNYEGDYVLNIKDWQDVDIEVTLDSGACRHVMPADSAPGYPIRDSPGSRRGQNFVVGNGQKVPNEGQMCLNLEAHVGDSKDQLVQSTFQVADLTRPLMSVSQVCESGHKCVFEKDQASIITAQGETLVKFEMRGGLYVATMRLKAPTPFGRPEQ